MITLAIALAVGLSASIAFGATVAYWYHSSISDRDAVTDLLFAEQHMSANYKSERDSLAISLKVSEDQRRMAETRLVLAETQRNEAMERAQKNVVQQIQNSTPAGAAGMVNDILSRPLPSLPQVARTSTGSTDRQTGPVFAAPPPAPPGSGRRDSGR